MEELIDQAVEEHLTEIILPKTKAYKRYVKYLSSNSMQCINLPDAIYQTVIQKSQIISEFENDS
jgi:D-alanine-D-alanine ligase-like ATP-grasp enzyme